MDSDLRLLLEDEIEGMNSMSLEYGDTIKAGVHLKAVLTSLNTAFLPISRSRFKQR